MLKNKLLALFFCLIFISECCSCFSGEWKRVYLATYPRSGNHWLRYLIEEASHIATGAVYCDHEPQHLSKPFPWGGYSCDHGYTGNCRYPTKADLVLIKTHFPSQNKVSKFDDLPYELVLRVVRHPVDSFYSRYVRQPRGTILEKVPTERVQEFIASWRKFQEYWNKKKNVVTILYEEALKNPSAELKKALEYLKYDFTDEDIARAVAKYPPEGSMLKHKNKFTDEDLNLIATELSDLLVQFGYSTPF